MYKQRCILNEDGVVGILQRIELIIPFVSNEKCYCSIILIIKSSKCINYTFSTELQQSKSMGRMAAAEGASFVIQSQAGSKDYYPIPVLSFPTIH